MTQNGPFFDRGLASFGSMADLAGRHAGEDGLLDANEFKAFSKAAGLAPGTMGLVDGADGSAKDGKVGLGELVARMGIVDHHDGVRGDNGLLSRRELRDVGNACIANAPLRQAATGPVTAVEAPTPEALFDAMDGADKRHAGAVTTGELFDFLVRAKDDAGRHLHGGDYRFNGDEILALAKATGLPEETLANLAGGDGYLTIDDLAKALKAADADGSGSLSACELEAMLAPPEPDPADALFDAVDGPDAAHAGQLTTGEVFDFLFQAKDAGGAPIHGGDYRLNGDEMAALAGATGFGAAALATMAAAYAPLGTDGILDAADVASAVAGADANGDGRLDRAEFAALIEGKTAKA